MKQKKENLGDNVLLSNLVIVLIDIQKFIYFPFFGLKQGREYQSADKQIVSS